MRLALQYQSIYCCLRSQVGPVEPCDVLQNENRSDDVSENYHIEKQAICRFNRYQDKSCLQKQPISLING